jgi:hypothetical protein
MNYTPAEFFALIEAVEEQGGEHLDAQCDSRMYEFTGSKQEPMTLPSCGNSALLLIPYEALNKDGSEAGLQPVQACAVDDDVARWPRFGGDKYAGAAYYVKPVDE